MSWRNSWYVLAAVMTSGSTNGRGKVSNPCSGNYVFLVSWVVACRSPWPVCPSIMNCAKEHSSILLSDGEDDQPVREYFVSGASRDDMVR